MKNVVRFPNRPLTSKEKTKLEIMEAIGGVNEAFVSRIGPLTHIHAKGLGNDNDWIIVIQHCPDGSNYLLLVNFLDFMLEAESRGLSVEQCDVFEDEF